MSSILPLTWADKKNSPLLADFIAKHGAEYCMTAEEINQLRDATNEMAVIQKTTFLGVAEPTDTPAGTGRGYWEVITPGTYTNFGGVVLGVDERGLIARDEDGGFKLSKIEYDFTSYVQLKNTFGIFNKSKNLFNKALSVNGYYIDIVDGTLKANELWFTSEFIEVDTDSTYSLSHESFWACYDSAKVFISGGLSNSKPLRIITTSNSKYIRTSAVLTDDTDNYQIEKGLFSSKYTSPNVINKDAIINGSISYEKTTFLKFTNLFNIANANIGYVVSASTGELLTNAPWFTSEFIEVTELSAYTLSHGSYWAGYDNNKVFISGGLANGTPAILIPAASTKYIRVSSVLTDVDNKYQVEAGNVSTAFVPFGYTFDKPIANYNEQNLTPVINTLIVRAGGYIGIDCDFIDIKSALEFITDNTKYNQYIVKVKNGTYDISGSSDPYLGLKNYVNIVGQTKSGVKVINRKATFSSQNAVFDIAYYSEYIEYASIKNMTLIGYNGKGPVHVDAGYDKLASGGTIEVVDCDLITENTLGQAHYQVALACGLRDGQRVVGRNINSNGILWVHNVDPLTTNTGCTFELYNCRFPFTNIADVYTYGKDKCIIHNCKADYVEFSLSNPFGHKRDYYDFSFNVDLVGNDFGYIQGNLVDAANPQEDFWDIGFGGKWGINDSNLHMYCRNNTAIAIPRYTLVTLDSTKSNEISIRPWTTNDKIYGQTLDNIPVGEYGTVQYRRRILVDANGSIPINFNDALEINSSGVMVKHSSGVIVAHAMTSLLSGTDKIRVELV